MPRFSGCSSLALGRSAFLLYPMTTLFGFTPDGKTKGIAVNQDGSLAMGVKREPLLPKVHLSGTSTSLALGGIRGRGAFLIEYVASGSAVINFFYDAKLVATQTLTNFNNLSKIIDLRNGKFAALSESFPDKLLIVDLPGRTTRTITLEAATVSYIDAVLSPDGAYLYAYAQASSTSGRVVKIDTTTEQVINQTAVSVSAPDSLGFFITWSFAKDKPAIYGFGDSKAHFLNPNTLAIDSSLTETGTIAYYGSTADLQYSISTAGVLKIRNDDDTEIQEISGFALNTAIAPIIVGSTLVISESLTIALVDLSTYQVQRIPGLGGSASLRFLQRLDDERFIAGRGDFISVVNTSGQVLRVAGCTDSRPAGQDSSSPNRFLAPTFTRLAYVFEV